MKSVNLSQNNARKRALLSTYKKSTRFGLVLGAGVTYDSEVPGYQELALNLLEEAINRAEFSGSKERAQQFIQDQRMRTAEERITIPPEEVILYVRSHLRGNEEFLRELIKCVMYKKVSVRQTAGREVFENNETLNAILTFCAARSSSVSPSNTDAGRIETNPKIGGILTTNYDNLVESAFHTKYRLKLLKPVGRPTTNEFDKHGRRIIPVYHIHGYVGYKASQQESKEPPGAEIIISEDDYFKTFYDPLGFGNYIALSFLRRFPCLFIGASMVDKNVRRFLFHLFNAAKGNIPDHQRKFAILKMSGSPSDDLVDANLLAYGVETIWIGSFTEIPGILRDLYINVKNDEVERETSAADWNYLKDYNWPRKAR